MRCNSILLVHHCVTSIPSAPAEAITKRQADWKATVAGWESNPKTGEGRKELLDKAKHLTAERDEAANAYHNFEYGAAALQLSIVLASASVITAMPALAVGAVGLGAVGTGLAGLGWFAPDVIPGLLHGGGHGEGGH